MWENLIERFDASSTIDFGIHQTERVENCPAWRRHDNRSRFANMRNGLFSNKGAYAACTAMSSYPKNKYSATGRLVVSYVAVWENTSDYAFLVRASTPHPEITIISASAINALSASTDAELLANLAALFGTGASRYGVRWLTAEEIVTPRNIT